MFLHFCNRIFVFDSNAYAFIGYSYLALLSLLTIKSEDINYVVPSPYTFSVLSCLPKHATIHNKEFVLLFLKKGKSMWRERPNRRRTDRCLCCMKLKKFIITEIMIIKGTYFFCAKKIIIPWSTDKIAKSSTL